VPVAGRDPCGPCSTHAGQIGLKRSVLRPVNGAIWTSDAGAHSAECEASAFATNTKPSIFTSTLPAAAAGCGRGAAGRAHPRDAAAAPSAHAKLHRFKMGRVLAKPCSQRCSRCCRRAGSETDSRGSAESCRSFYLHHGKVALLLRTARDYPTPTARAPLRPFTLYTMLVLAYCAGLRLARSST